MFIQLQLLFFCAFPAIQATGIAITPVSSTIVVFIVLGVMILFLTLVGVYYVIKIANANSNTMEQIQNTNLSATNDNPTVSSFKIGDKVRMRDTVENSWMLGKITRVHPLEAKEDYNPSAKSFSWKFIELFDPEPVTKNETNPEEKIENVHHQTNPKEKIEDDIDHHQTNPKEKIEDDHHEKTKKAHHHHHHEKEKKHEKVIQEGDRILVINSFTSDDGGAHLIEKDECLIIQRIEKISGALLVDNVDPDAWDSTYWIAPRNFKNIVDENKQSLNQNDLFKPEVAIKLICEKFIQLQMDKKQKIISMKNAISTMITWDVSDEMLEEMEVKFRQLEDEYKKELNFLSQQIEMLKSVDINLLVSKTTGNIFTIIDFLTKEIKESSKKVEDNKELPEDNLNEVETLALLKQKLEALEDNINKTIEDIRNQ